MKSLSTRRLIVLLILLSASGGVQLLRNRAEIRPNPPKLQGFPRDLGQWKSSDDVIAQSVLDVLGPGDFLSRNYRRPGEPPIDLFVAYFPTQRSGDTIHSPKNCLPGSGWQPVDSGRKEIALNGGQALRVTRYVVAKGSERQLVLYWFQSHGKTTSSEYTAKLQLFTDAIRVNRTDGALVRIVTPVLPYETESQSEQRAAEFIRATYPGLNDFIPL
jgi:EpsI family protein